MRDDDRAGRMWTMLKYSSVGLEMGVATLIGWGIGYWLDLQFGSYPALMFVFLAVGVAAGFKGVFRAAREAQEIMGDRPAGAAEAAETPAAPAESNPGMDQDSR